MPALNLCQASEFSLVIVALGVAAQHVGETVSGVVAYAFVILAVHSGYAMVKSDAVLDFNPQVNRELARRGVTVIYGDISQRGTLLHAGLERAEVIVCTIPNALLKGSTQLRLVQQLRQINPGAKIIAHAELFEEIPRLYAAGADYVSVPRLIEAQVLCDVLLAAHPWGISLPNPWGTSSSIRK